MILVDSNVLIDIFENDARWADWSIGQVAHYSRTEALAVNHITIAETAPKLGSMVTFHAMLADLSLSVEPFSDEAAFAAGVAFQKHRSNGGKSKSVLPDFFIGGHAQALGATILTRDPRFYRTYFPAVPLITPETTEP